MVNYDVDSAFRSATESRSTGNSIPFLVTRSAMVLMNVSCIDFLYTTHAQVWVHAMLSPCG